jgi:flagellar motor switch/type III secretory pathway protein FliN
VTDTVREWLPKGAFEESAIKLALAEPIAQWSKCWFSREQALVSLVRTNFVPLTERAQKSAFSSTQTVIEWSKRGKRYLLENALDVQLSDLGLIDGDRRVMEAFATAVIEDLDKKLSSVLGNNPVSDRDARVCVTLEIAGHDMAMVTLSQNALIPLLKKQLGGSRRSEAALRGRTKALGPTTVQVEGILGDAELAMADLKGLEIGDVLVLNRQLNQAIDLRLSGGGGKIGRGRLSHHNGHVSIQF